VEGFLPPKAPGPEPDLGPRPQPEAPQPVASAPQPVPSAPPPPGAYAPQPVQPDNGPAVSGFVLSIVAAGLLLISGGISSIVSMGCAIFGIVQSRKGTRKVESGETTRNAGLAKAGFIIGIVALVLSVIATVAWILIVVLIATDEEFRQDFEDEFDDNNSITALRIVGTAARALLT
jgi:hypothetical protein